MSIDRLLVADSKSSQSRQGSSLLLLFVCGVIFCILLVALTDPSNWLQTSLEFVRRQGKAAPYLFVALYVASCVLLLPGFILTMGAGAIFGLPQGMALLSAGVTIGGAAAFLIGRYFVRDWVQAKVAQEPKLKNLDCRVAEQGWKIVLLVRLTPLIPFRLSNYAFGATKISFTHFVLATWLGTLPSTAFYVYSGTLIGQLAEVSAFDYFTEHWWISALGAIVLALLVIFLVKLWRGRTL